MLQRAASNAYSWWWASHIRTKQSKWLEQNLQDMEEKVNYTLEIIDDDGDTFAQRAEMYYRKRPEIVGFVEEAFRSYRALAERYDHLSRELQSANRTIATVFPEHVQFPLDDEDDENPDKPAKHLQLITKGGNIPQVPEIPKKDVIRRQSMLSRKGPANLKRTWSSAARREVASSGLSKAEALEEIDKLQKAILALQTDKEFLRSSYEHLYEKYSDIENEITEMQKRVCNVQDEFGIGSVIDDSEARALMASTVLNSCRDTIIKLEEKQKQSAEEAKIEKERIRSAKEKFEALRNKFEQKDHNEHQTKEFENASVSKGSGFVSLRENVKEEIELASNDTLTVIQFAEKIDELVEKVVSLETTASSQTALVKTLRSEIDELHEHIRGLEEDKASLLSGSEDMERRIRMLEEELSRVKSLYQRVEDQDNKLQIHFTEASCRIDALSGKLHSVRMDEDVEGAGLFQEMRAVSGDAIEENPSEGLNPISEEEPETKNKQEEKKDEVVALDSEGSEKLDVVSEKPQEMVREEKPEKKDLPLSETASTNFDTEPEDMGTEDDEETPDWKQLFPNGLEDGEKILLEEYSTALRNYREVKRKLSEVEKKNRDGFFELALQIRELKNAVAYRDVEIQSLRHKVDSPDKDSSNHPTEGNQSDHEGQRESISHLSISPVSNFLSSTSSHQQGGEFKKTPAKTKVKFVPTVEERVRADIDELLEENLEFWLRFSTSVHQVQKFQNSVHDLKSELSKLNMENRKQEDSADPTKNKQLLASETRPIYRHLREIRTELQLWLENNAILKDELQERYTSLCNIQDEISRVTSNTDPRKGGGETEISEYQAAKFHGEVLNMKQENTKVSNELQVGLDRVKALKIEVERVLGKVEEDLGISNAKNSQSQTRSSSSGRPRIPLRSFLFGVKLKKHKQQKSPSLFSCVSPSLQRQNSYITPPEKLPE